MKVLLFVLFFLSSCVTATDNDWNDLQKSLGVAHEEETMQLLICSCKKPALIIDENGVWVFDSTQYDAHINQMVLLACNDEMELPGVDTYDTSQSGHPCPIDL